MIYRMLMMAANNAVAPTLFSSLYVANSGDSTISIFDRNVSTGALTANGTIGTGNYPYGIVVSPDGKNVYVTNYSDNSLSVFNRNVLTGSLTLNSTITSVNGAQEIAISADGKSVYVNNVNSYYFSLFDRNVSTGALTLNTIITTAVLTGLIAISADGKSVYVTTGVNSILIFDRNVSTGALTANGTINSLYQPQGIAISANGENVYTTNPYQSLQTIFSVITTYSRNTTTGAITFVSQIATGFSGTQIASTNPTGICISADGKNAYVCNTSTNEIAEFNRNVSNGGLSLITQPVFTIPAGNAPYGIVISSDGKSVYSTNSQASPSANWTVSIFDRNVSTGILSGSSTITVGTNPYGIAIYP